MREVLCFGDSNTWGYDPVTRERFPGNVRWTGVLQAALGPGFRVIEEGLNGRTTVWEDPIEGDKMGKRHLPVCLASHAPLDLVIMMLGTNDTKKRYSAPSTDIAAGVGVLLDIVARSAAGRDDTAPPGAGHGPRAAHEAHRVRPDVRGRRGEVARARAAVRGVGESPRLPLLRCRESDQAALTWTACISKRPRIAPLVRRLPARSESSCAREPAGPRCADPPRRIYSAASSRARTSCAGGEQAAGGLDILAARLADRGQHSPLPQQ